MRIESGVLVMKNGKAWGVKYADGHSTSYGWIDPYDAKLSDPKYCTSTTDVTYEGSPYIAELLTAELVLVERRVELRILGGQHGEIQSRHLGNGARRSGDFRSGASLEHGGRGGMRRDEMMVSTYEDATQWLDEFSHTIQDEQVQKVVELLRAAGDEFRDEAAREVAVAEEAADAECARLDEKIAKLEDDIADRDEELRRCYDEIEDLREAQS